MKLERKDAPRPTKHDIARKPGKDDVHEQREHAQPYEGVVHVAPRRGDHRKKSPAHAKR